MAGAVGKSPGVRSAKGSPNSGSGPVGKGGGPRAAKGSPNAGSGPVGKSPGVKKARAGKLANKASDVPSMKKTLKQTGPIDKHTLKSMRQTLN